MPLLRNASDEELSGRDLFWHYPHYGNQGGDPSSSIRSGPWKLIHYYEDGHDELYNLESDPGEQNDVRVEHQEQADELRRRLDQWLIDVNATFPISDPQHDAQRERERMRMLEYEFMPQLEADHAEYLDPNWQPNEDWWGSMVVVD